MAEVVINFRIMLDNPKVNANKLKDRLCDEIKNYGGNVGRCEIEPVAFGLKAVNVLFSIDEKKGSTDILEEKLKSISGVKNVEVVDVRRAFG